MPISNQQKAVIHVAKSQLHMADEDYRALLLRLGHVNSSADLDEPGFQAVMTEFERLGFHSVKTHTQTARREGMATPAQIGKILGLWKSYSGNDDDLRMGRWLEKHFHVSHLRFLDVTRAGKAIAILTRMAERARSKRGSNAKPSESKEAP